MEFLDFADFVLFFVRPVISVGSNEMTWKEMLLLLRLENVAWFFCTSEFTVRISLALVVKLRSIYVMVSV